MKVFDIEREATRELFPGEALPAILIADSALQQPGVPLFVPPFAQKPGREWTIDIVPVYEITRLGKCVDEKFAHRYVGSLRLGARLRPAGGVKGEALKACFDGALCLSEPVEIGTPDGVPFDSDLKIVVRQTPIADQETTLRELTVFVPSGLLQLPLLVSELSQFCTLKTGDRIIPLHAVEGVPATLDTRIIASLNGHPLLNLKIK